MILDDVTSFWWESITGPQLLVEKLATCLSDGTSVVLRLDSALPWRAQLRDFVAHLLSQVKLRSLCWNGGIAKEQIVPALLEQLCRSELSVCPSDYRSQLKYLKNEAVFANSVVWLSTAGREDQTALLQFLSDYRGLPWKGPDTPWCVRA